MILTEMFGAVKTSSLQCNANKYDTGLHLKIKAGAGEWEL